MFSLAILIGIYSYFIFALGLLGLLYKENVVVITLAFFILILWWGRRRILRAIGGIREIRGIRGLLFLLFIIQALVNLVGALGPELAFDALWYHLTLPKLYLINQAVIHIPGGLLYYSSMPKLTEMLYTSALAFQGEILAKLIHFSFGILSSIALYKLSRKFFSPALSVLTVIVFYSNLVVAWQSITAYVDLARTFFEVMALWGFINFVETKKQKWLIESAVMMGLAISTKLLGIGSLFIFLVFIIYYNLYKKRQFINVFVYLLIAFLIPLPWFVFSFVHTGNPIYPFFTEFYKVNFDFNLINPLQLADPISPLYIIFLPISIFMINKFDLKFRMIIYYSLLALLVWYLTAKTGGGRFIMPYLPAFSIIVVGAIGVIREIRVKKILVSLVVVTALFSIIYRGVANAKYLPVILGQQTKSEFLTKHLNFSFGDFYDIDNYFKNNIKSEDMVLLYGFHNLYYIDFPFIDASWVKKGDKFNYIAIQNTKLPERFNDWVRVYDNKTTSVKLYSKGGVMWEY